MKTLLGVLFLLVNTDVSSAQWIIKNSGTTNHLETMSFPASDTGFVADDHYRIHKTINGGNTWNLLPATLPGYFIDFISTSIGFCGGTDIQKTNDGGQTWNDNFNFTNFSYIIGFSFPTNTTGYALGIDLQPYDSTLIYKTIDQGLSWTYVSGTPALSASGSIWFTDSVTGYLSKSIGTIAKTIDGGSTWIQQFSSAGTFGINKVYFVSHEIGFFICDNGNIFKTNDGGNVWQLQSNTNPLSLFSIFFPTLSHGFAAGGDGVSMGVILESSDSGATWNVSAWNSQTMMDLFFTSPSTGYVCGTYGTILKYHDPNGIAEVNHSSIGISILSNPIDREFIFIYSVGEPQNVSLKIFNLTGQKIATLQDGNETAGQHSIKFSTSGISPGIYLYSFISENRKETGKIVVGK